MTDKLRILLTNDDGIHSKGLEVAETIARTLTDDVWVVAPETEQSGASHSLTITTPLRLRKIDARHFAVSGTPTDCVMLATTHLIKGAQPTLLLSGVNRGVNVADDVTYSGTIAGAMEGCALDIPSIALSQAYNFEEAREVQWACAETHGPALIRKLIEIGWPKDVPINVNFPDCPPEEVKGVEIVAQGKRDLQEAVIDKRVDMRGYPYFWIGFRRERVSAKPGTDLGALYAKRISVTPLQLNLTETKVMEMLRQQMDSTLPLREGRTVKPFGEG